MKSLFVVLCLTMAYLSVGAQKIYKFQNTKLSDEKRIDALLEELMLEEKIALLGSDLAVPRLGYPVAQKCLLPNLYFRFPCFSKIIIADFPFKYPIKLETQYFGGILSSRCTWSGIICPSKISTPFHLHKSRMYCCISARSWL